MIINGDAMIAVMNGYGINGRLIEVLHFLMNGILFHGNRQKKIKIHKI